jgi:hypothetical protein
LIRTQNAVRDRLVTVSKQWCKLQVNTNKHEDLNLMFENHGKKDGIYSLITIEIAKAQKKDHQMYSKKMQEHQRGFLFSAY